MVWTASSLHSPSISTTIDTMVTPNAWQSMLWATIIHSFPVLRAWPWVVPASATHFYNRCSIGFDAKPFKCSECSKTYYRWDRFNDHLRNGHDILPTHLHRWFQCPFNCGKESFCTMAQLLVHCEKDIGLNLGKYTDFSFIHIVYI